MSLRDIVKKVWKPALGIVIGLAGVRGCNQLTSSYTWIKPYEQQVEQYRNRVDVKRPDGILGVDTTRMHVYKNAYGSYDCFVDQTAHSLLSGHSWIRGVDEKCDGTVEEVTTSEHGLLYVSSDGNVIVHMLAGNRRENEKLFKRAEQMVAETRKDARFAQYFPGQ